MITTNFFSSITVSLIALSVIFLVLVILIYTIKVLVHFLPYEEPPASSGSPSPAAGGSNEDELVATITATMAAHLNRTPQEFHIVNIRPH